MGNIFVSFIHEEEFAAGLMRAFLHEVFSEKIDVFLSADQTTIYAGDDWMKRIVSELKSTKVLLSILSHESVQRPWINFEAGAAWMHDATVIPVCIRGLTIESLPKPYSSLQAVILDSAEAAHYLVSSIAHHLNLEIPEKPYFGPAAGAILSGRDPDEEKRKGGPYKRIASLLNSDKEAYEAEIALEMIKTMDEKENPPSLYGTGGL